MASEGAGWMLFEPVKGLPGLVPEYGGAVKGVRPRFELEVVIRRLRELWGLTFAVLVIGLVMLGHDECLFSQFGWSQGCNKEQVVKKLGKARGEILIRLRDWGFYTFITTHERVISKAPQFDRQD